ncbi:MAG: GNAT family N-acetyltransferase [Nanoarchaeota archaeon]|nr:GNAT family N-acetyltransferase [Nanoarchaeota archaeon]
MSLAEKVKIVEAQREDILGIASVLNDTLGQDFKYGIASFEENVKYCFSRSLEHKHEKIYVAKDDEDVVGFAWFMNHPPNNGTAILEMFAVRKDKQRLGIGSRLITEASDMFIEDQRRLGVNLRTLHLTTNYSNEGAQTIYTRAGYIIAGEIKCFVGDGNVEVVMVKKVSNEACPAEYKTKI